MEAHPDVALTSRYGPVESTVFITTHRIGPGDLLRPGGIPIGICVPGTTVYVLDGDRECGRDEEGRSVSQATVWPSPTSTIRT